jgi:hypothetical protein
MEMVNQCMRAIKVNMVPAQGQPLAACMRPFYIPLLCHSVVLGPACSSVTVCGGAFAISHAATGSRACCTRRWLKTVTKRSFRTTARSGPSILPQCAAPRVGTSWSAPAAIAAGALCKRSRVICQSDFALRSEHSAPSQCSWPHPPPSWPKA